MINLGVTVLLLIVLMLLKITLTQWVSTRREHEGEEHIHPEIVYKNLMQKPESGFNSSAPRPITLEATAHGVVSMQMRIFRLQDSKNEKY